MAITIYATLIAILIGVIAAAAFGRLDTEWTAAVSAALPILITLLARTRRGVT